jgi:hypothetical protein
MSIFFFELLVECFISPSESGKSIGGDGIIGLSIDIFWQGQWIFMQ